MKTKKKKNGITRNQDASCPVRNAEKCSLIKPHSFKAGRNSEMLSITRRKKNLQLLTDLCLVLPWTLSLISFQAQWLAGFSWSCLLWGGGTIISLILSTFIFSSVSIEFLAVGILSAPILVHLLSVRLKPLKCVASRFLTVFLEACSSESFYLRNVPSIQEIHDLKGQNESAESACHSVGWQTPVCWGAAVPNFSLPMGPVWPCHVDGTIAVWSLPPKGLAWFTDAKMAKGTAVRADWKINASRMYSCHRPWETTLKDLPKPPQQRDATLLENSHSWFPNNGDI